MDSAYKRPIFHGSSIREWGPFLIHLSKQDVRTEVGNGKGYMAICTVGSSFKACIDSINSFGGGLTRHICRS
jgi:hypothetical protein